MHKRIDTLRHDVMLSNDVFDEKGLKGAIGGDLFNDLAIGLNGLNFSNRITSGGWGLDWIGDTGDPFLVDGTVLLGDCERLRLGSTFSRAKELECEDEEFDGIKLVRMLMGECSSRVLSSSLLFWLLLCVVWLKDRTCEWSILAFQIKEDCARSTISSSQLVLPVRKLSFSSCSKELSSSNNCESIIWSIPCSSIVVFSRRISSEYCEILSSCIYFSCKILLNDVTSFSFISSSFK